MDLFDLQAVISLDPSAFEKGIDTAKKTLNNFSSILGKATNGFKAIENVGKKTADVVKTGMKAFAAAETALVGFGTAAVKAGMNFDKTMSEVSAISGAVGKDFDALRDKALEMGAKTKFSASEAGEAMTYMAMAGWKTEDMLSGIAGIMDLAAASGEDLATTSDIVTDALTAFGKAASDSGHLADIMAAASSNANTNVSMLGESFKYVAPVAGALGYTMEDTSLALGLMANSGIKASQAGTTLRTALTNMASPTKNMKAVMSEYNLSLTHTDGTMKSLAEVMDELRAKMGGLDEATQAADASLLFGKEAMSGMLAIINASEEDYEKLADAIYECDGAAKQMADTMVDNLAGDLTLLGSAFESLQIALSDGLTPTLREFAQFGQESMAQLLEGFQGNGLTGLFGELTIVVTDGVNMLADEAPKFVQIGVDFLTAMGEGLINSAPNILTAAREMTGMLASGISGFVLEHGPELVEIGTSIIEFLSEGFGVIDSLIPLLGDFVVAIADGIASHASDLFNTGLTVITTIIDGIAQHIDEVIAVAENLVQSIFSGIMENVPVLLEAGIEIIGGVLSGVTEALPQIAEAAVSVIQGFAGYIRENLPVMIETGLQMLMEFSTSLRENVGLIIDAALDLMLALGQGLADGLPAIIEYVPEIVSNIANIINDNLPKILETGIKIIGALAVGLVEAIPVLIENVPKIIGAIVDVITAFNWLDLGGKVVTGFLSGITALLGDVSATAGTIVQNITTILSDLPGFLQALGGDMINGLINGVKACFGAVKDNIVQLAELVIGTFKNLLGIHSPSTVFAAIGGNIVDGLKNGVANAWGNFMNFISSKVGGVVSAVKSMLGIHSPSTVFAGIGENMALGLSEGWADQYSSVKSRIENGLNFGTANVSLNALGTPGGIDSGTHSNRRTISYNETAQPVTIIIKPTLNDREIGEATYHYLIDRERAYGGWR